MNYDNRMSYNDMIVIEQSDDSDYRFDFDYFTCIAIGFVYVFFLSLIVDRLLNHDLLEQVNDAMEQVYNTKDKKYADQYNARIKEHNKVIAAYNTQKFIFMIILGVMSIMSGGYLANCDARYAMSGRGIALGGVISIIYYTAHDWTNINKDIKVIVLGLTLAFLLYGSTQHLE